MFGGKDQQILDEYFEEQGKPDGAHISRVPSSSLHPPPTPSRWVGCLREPGGTHFTGSIFSPDPRAFFIFLFPLSQPCAGLATVVSLEKGE